MPAYSKTFLGPKSAVPFLTREKLLMSSLTPRSSFHGMTFAAQKTFREETAFSGSRIGAAYACVQ
jgi:hypothetical protein